MTHPPQSVRLVLELASYFGWSATKISQRTGIARRTVCDWINGRLPKHGMQDVRHIFCLACDMMNVRWTEAPHTVCVSRKYDVALLDEFIGAKR